MRVKLEVNCLAQPLIIAIAKITDDANYKSSRWTEIRPRGPTVTRNDRRQSRIGERGSENSINLRNILKNMELFFRVLIVKTIIRKRQIKLFFMKLHVITM